MSLLSLLRKPAWEHRDPTRRAAAVATATDPALMARLPELARQDDVPAVRLAALRRVDDLSLLGDRMRNDTDAGVRALARQRYLQRLLDPALPLPERERVVAVEDDGDILVALAQQAPESALRRLALERVARPGLIAERCVKDPDPDLRRWLLDKIDDTATLERIAERVRKTDKLLARTARERALAVRLAAGDPVATQERALAICETLDALRRSAAADAAAQRDVLRDEWNRLKERLDQTTERRVEGYFAALDAALAPPAPEPAADPAPELPLPEPQAAESGPLPGPAREPDVAFAAMLAELEARAERLRPHELEQLEHRWLERLRRIEPLLPEEHAQAERFRTLATGLHTRFEQRARERRDVLAGLAGRIDALEAAVEAGQVADARQQLATLDADRKRLGEQFPRPLARRLGDAARQLDRLGQWQHWSGNKARLRLIEDIDALAASGLHPDALAVRLKELQAEWQRLDDSEARDGEHPLTRRFRAASHHALAPARAYFEKRRELRGARREEIQAAQDALDADLAAAPAARELVALRRRTLDQLRLCDELDPAARRDLSRSLRERLKRIETALAASEAEGEAAKRKVLANLRRDLMHADLAAALPLARDAQARWKTLPRAARKTEDALWTELRELVDPWFAQADEKQRERQQLASAQTIEARAILDELAHLAEADAGELAQAETRLAGLQARWRAVAEASPEPPPVLPRESGRRPPRLPRTALDERAYDRAVARVHAARERLAQDQRRAGLRALAEAATLCDQLDALSMDAPQGRRAELVDHLAALTLPGDARAALQARLDSALDPERTLPLQPGVPVPDDRAAELTVLAELAAGIDSPADARDLRRRLQIERLSERLSGGTSGADDLRALLLDYAGLIGVSSDLRTRLAPRWQAVLEQIIAAQ